MTAIVKLILMIFLPWIVVFLLLRSRRRYLWLSFSGIFAMQLFAMLPIGYMVVVAANEASQTTIQMGAIYNQQYRVSQSQLHGLAGWQGVDITSGCGSPIYAPFSGTVTYVGLDGYNHVDERGIVWDQATMLTIQGDSGLELTLLHGDYLIGYGEKVQAGKLIGTENSHGWTTGCHSHVILKQNGQTLNFLEWQSKGNSIKPLKISWYDPSLCYDALGHIKPNINCDSDPSRFASMVEVTEDRYGKTAACLPEWMGAYVVMPGIGEFQCLDTGGAIVEHPEFIYIDLLLHDDLPHAPWGTMVDNWYLEWR